MATDCRNIRGSIALSSWPTRRLGYGFPVSRSPPEVPRRGRQGQKSDMRGREAIQRRDFHDFHLLRAARSSAVKTSLRFAQIEPKKTKIHITIV
ncbi:hypothetical protein L596_025645 [Steinernema carpocapsae]|uniref:Uncharacterized protein n=1 Tax=Steinernema carpocapsae TaxID=34508 RepID=A0A4U5M978_STECR|nr:hypothetical protein L596_025645 [Steinernema carpocapsae]